MNIDRTRILLQQQKKQKKNKKTGKADAMQCIQMPSQKNLQNGHSLSLL